MGNISNRLAQEFNLKIKQVENFIELLDGGNTVPFIARYRKEVTGGLDDITLRNLSERLTYLRNLEDRKKDVERLIEEQGNMTEEIKANIEAAETLTEVEDIYRPFKPKKRTRATIAVEKGLKPLAEIIFNGEFSGDIKEYAKTFINEEKGVKNEEEALKGAMDIISEMISDVADYRKWIRSLVFREGIIETNGSSEEPTPYEMYYNYSEAVKSIPPHRILAINRGEKEKYYQLKLL